MSDRNADQNLREALVSYGVKLVETGLVQGTWGNISVRCMFAAARKPLPVENPRMQDVFGTEIPLAGYGLPGSKLLSRNTVDAFGDGMGAIMTAHGMICGGRDLETAFENCEKMEHCAADYIESRWAELE